jgi:hypothetical protein
MVKKVDDNWSCGGWEGHDRSQMEETAKLSFRERLLWLQDADRFAAELEKRRPWIDKDGMPRSVVQPASTQAARAEGSG